jgi:hypothetical protein
MFKKAVQRGRSERRGEAYSSPYVEPLSDARTKLADFFNILLVIILIIHGIRVLSDKAKRDPPVPTNRYSPGTLAVTLERMEV